MEETLQTIFDVVSRVDSVTFTDVEARVKIESFIYLVFDTPRALAMIAMSVYSIDKVSDPTGVDYILTLSALSVQQTTNDTLVVPKRDYVKLSLKVFNGTSNLITDMGDSYSTIFTDERVATRWYNNVMFIRELIIDKRRGKLFR